MARRWRYVRKCRPTLTLPKGGNEVSFGCLAQTLRVFGPNAAGVWPKRYKRMMEMKKTNNIKYKKWQQ
ncbi:MAG TPA: hypothetical protein DEQ27_08030 [Prevotella sp.]|nr:hypothetical protein [Prevotella sp.]